MEEIKVIKYESVGDLTLRITFNDNTVQVIDFTSFLDRATNPMITQYQDPDKFFSDINLEYGELIWGDYEMLFPVWDLYNGIVDFSKDNVIKQIRKNRESIPEK